MSLFIFYDVTIFFNRLIDKEFEKNPLNCKLLNYSKNPPIAVEKMKFVNQEEMINNVSKKFKRSLSYPLQ